MTGDQISPIAVPGATFTAATRINARGHIVGRYVKDGVNHGFLLVVVS